MVAAFLLAFPALFSIVNPLAGAFLFREATAERTHEERVRLARRVAFYSLLVILVALWGGSYVLAFFGISIGALRVAGGLVLTGFAWELLGAPEKREDRKQRQASAAGPGGAGGRGILPAHSPVHHRAGHDLGRGGDGRRAPRGRRRPVRVLRRCDPRRGDGLGHDRADLWVRGPAGRVAGTEREPPRWDGCRRSSCSASACRYS